MTNAYSQTYLKTVQNQLSAIFNQCLQVLWIDVNPSKTGKEDGKGKGKRECFSGQKKIFEIFGRINETKNRFLLCF